MIVTIERFDKLAGSPALDIAVEAWDSLITSGLMSDQSFLLQWNNSALLARNEQGQSVGVLVYTDIDWENKLGVVLGYVRPVYRQQGVYRKLWEAVVERAQTMGRPRIEGATRVENATMQVVMDKLGRTATHLLYHFEVPKEEVSG